jgi:hypothetical protein
MYKYFIEFHSDGIPETEIRDLLEGFGVEDVQIRRSRVNHVSDSLTDTEITPKPSMSNTSAKEAALYTAKTQDTFGTYEVSKDFPEISRKEAGVQLIHMEKSGTLERVSHGRYRLARYHTDENLPHSRKLLIT